MFYRDNAEGWLQGFFDHLPRYQPETEHVCVGAVDDQRPLDSLRQPARGFAERPFRIQPCIDGKGGQRP